MTPVSRDPLTPEERELATRLSRIGPHGEPPAALDARILSSAHAALSTKPLRHRRWPAVLGVAATLALAVGVTWQLRPHPDAAPVLEEGPEAADVATQVPYPEAAPSAALPPNAGAAATERAVSEMADAAAATPPPPAEANSTAETPRPTPAPTVATRPKASPPKDLPVIAPPVEVVSDEEPMELAPTMSPAPPPAPPAAPPAPVPERAASLPSAPTAERAAPVSGAAKAARRSASPAPVTADMPEVGSAPPMGDRPMRELPIDDDARLAPADWLDRIRQRQAADDLEGARASLGLFRRYHPDRTIPQDLAHLAQ